MKYWGSLFFIFLSVWTWRVVNDTPDVSFETHVGIQAKIAEMIVRTVQEKKPQASDVVVTQIWTERTGHGKVKAHFTYQFNESSSEIGKTSSSIQGTGDLERTTDSQEENDVWKLSRVQIDGDTVQFEDGLVIQPNAN